MQFNTYTNNDPRSFMYYKGDYYVNKTEVAFKDEFIKNKTYNGKKIWKYARFSNVTTLNNQTAYLFNRSKYSFCDLLSMGYDTPEERNTCKNDYAPFFVLTTSEVDCAIENFTKPIKLSKEETEAINNAIIDMIENPKTDWDYPEMRLLWVVYIAVLIGSLIFKEFYILWAVASYIFFTWRKDIVK